MENEAIGNSQITASSTWNDRHAPWQARLNFKEIGGSDFQVFYSGGWQAGKDDISQWLQVDLKCETKITKIATQGRNSQWYDQWVKEYKLQYGRDNSSFQFYKLPGKDSAKVKFELSKLK